MKHVKDFRQVQRDLQPARSLAEVIGFYYAVWRNTPAYVAMKENAEYKAAKDMRGNKRGL
jgi:hypothetical protein